jgi:hypothetical protein
VNDPRVSPPSDERLDQLERSLFFIVGCGRSGTTLLQAILLGHPDIAIPPETKFLAKFGTRLSGGRGLANDAAFRRALEAVTIDQRRKGLSFDSAAFVAYAERSPRTWEGILLAILAAVADRAGKPRAGEKSPSHTPWIARLAEAFPHAKFLHTIRDPRAVMLSRINAPFTSGMIGTEVKRWREAALAHRTHAEALGPSRYLAIRYEQLVNDPAVHIRAVCDFLGLDASPVMFTPHMRDDKGFPTHAAEWMGNTMRPIFVESVERWRTRLTSTQVAMIEHALRDEMLALGYEPIGAKAGFVRTRLLASQAVGKSIYFRRKLRRGLRRVLNAGNQPPRSAHD